MVSLDIDIPGDIVLEILKGLPVKSFLRFRCVSKEWRSIIDDPYFVDMHRLRSYHRLHGVKLLVSLVNTVRHKFGLLDLEGNLSRITCPPDDTNRWMNGDAVEGLVCIGNTIWNPATRKSFRLPDPPQPPLIPCPLIKEGGLVLGFNSGTKQYKVLSIKSLHYDYFMDGKWKLEMHILTLGTDNCWRNISHCVPTKDAPSKLGRYGWSLYVKDKIYSLFEYSTQRFTLMAFSVGEEKFNFVRLPRWWLSVGKWRMIEVRGEVGLIRGNGLKLVRLTDFETAKWEEMRIPEGWAVGDRRLVKTNFYIGDKYLLWQSPSSLVLSCFYYYDVLGPKSGFWEGPSLKGSKSRFWGPEGPSLKGERVVKILCKQVETLFDPSTPN